MSRNASGTYTLPTGNPVVSGTVITSTWANTTLSDIATALTDSLSRSGQGGMTAALRIIDGTVSVPGLGFTNETGSGLYRAAAGDYSLAVLGAQVLRLQSAGVSITGTLGVSGGVTLSGGTANGVLYLNGSKAVTSGSALTFDGGVTFNLISGSAYPLISVASTVPNNIFGFRMDGSTGTGNGRDWRIEQGRNAVGQFNITDITAGNAVRYSIGSDGTAIWNVGAGTGSEQMRLTSTGLGIGTTAAPYSAKFNSFNTANTPAGVFQRPITITNAISVANSYIYMRGSDNGYGLAIGNYSATQWIQGMVNDAPSLDIALNPSGGNVGIGTSSPSVKLDVQGGRSYFASSSDAFATYLRYNNSTAGVFLGSPSANAFQISSSGGGAYLNIDSSGNVGIGTTSPYNWGGASISTGSYSSTVTYGTYGANNYYNSGWKYGGNGIAWGIGNNFGGVTNGVTIAVATSNTGGAGAALTWNPAFNIDSSGNVGIGTSSPGAKLYVYQSGTTPPIAWYQNSNGTYPTASFGGAIDYNFSAGNAEVGFWNTYTAAATAFTFRQQTGASTRTDLMTILSSGNVGIGTSSPSKKLEVYASANSLQIESIVRNDQPGTGIAAIGFNVSAAASGETSSTKAGIGLVRQAPYGVGALCFYNNGTYSAGDFTTADERMRITANGGVSFGSSGTAYGSTGQKLVSNGDAAPTWGSGIVSGTAQATTSGTAKDFTGIPSWVKRITVMLQGVSTNGASQVLVQLGAGSITTSGYLGTGFSAANGGSPGITSYTTGFGIGSDSSAAYVRHGSLTLCLLGSNTWVCSGWFAQSDAARAQASGGSVTLAGTLDRIRLTTVNGTDAFDAGNVNIFYE